MRLILKVRKKGILILPKALRDKVGIKEGDEVLVEVREDSIVLRPLEPLVVDIDPSTVSKIVEKEKDEWDRKTSKVLQEVSS